MRTVKLGIFGVGMRGKHFYNDILLNNGEIVAVCDASEECLKNARETLGESLATYTDFDAFLEHEGMEAILVSNYFHEHAPYAIRALEKNIHVLSECLSNGTMADGVALVRAAERSKAIYMLAENYPFMLFNQEMHRVYQGGTLGRVLFAEGEYNHPVDGEDMALTLELCPHSKHWRYFLPRTYYITHSLAPLMYITGSTPVRVTAMPVVTPYNTASMEGISRGVAERAAIVTCQNDDGSVFRVTGCAAFGHHENSYRICGERGQIENLRDHTDRVLLSYNAWQTPEGAAECAIYKPRRHDKDEKLIAQASHGGGDFCVIREFFNCVREGRRPLFDVYFATTTASVAILGHRSMLEGGVPYDIPDFRREEDRAAYETDTLTPFYGHDGSEPTIPATTCPAYGVTEEDRRQFDERVDAYITSTKTAKNEQPYDKGQKQKNKP